MDGEQQRERECRHFAAAESPQQHEEQHHARDVNHHVGDVIHARIGAADLRVHHERHDDERTVVGLATGGLPFDVEITASEGVRDIAKVLEERDVAADEVGVVRLNVVERHDARVERQRHERERGERQRPSHAADVRR